MTKQRNVRAEKGVFSVEKILGKTPDFFLYLAHKEGQERDYIMKVAASKSKNALLDREAFLLKHMLEKAQEFEAEYTKVKGKKKDMLNYQLTFPTLEESFIAEETDGKRVNIICFDRVEKIGALVPIGHITKRDKVRVDPRTAAWMMGKLLKVLDFAHKLGIHVNRVTGENILIHREQHYVVLFDWSKAAPTGLTKEASMQDIVGAAREIIIALGGDKTTGVLPQSDQLGDGEFEAFLRNLLQGRENNALHAHDAFYTLIRGKWPREFYPFTAHPIH